MKRYSKPVVTALVMAALFFTTSAAMAEGFTGNWPATVTGSTRDNGTYCLQLTDDGSYGFPHSGEAIILPNQGQYPGYFTVVNGIMTVTFTFPSGEGDCCDYIVFTAKASGTKVTTGVFNYFGITDIGDLAFGKKNGCSE